MWRFIWLTVAEVLSPNKPKSKLFLCLIPILTEQPKCDNYRKWMFLPQGKLTKNRTSKATDSGMRYNRSFDGFSTLVHLLWIHMQAVQCTCTGPCGPLQSLCGQRKASYPALSHVLHDPLVLVAVKRLYRLSLWMPWILSFWFSGRNVCTTRIVFYIIYLYWRSELTAYLHLCITLQCFFSRSRL